MAGDWIKMRVDLADDPAVISMAAALGICEDEVVGKLHRLWSWADRHTTDGTAPGITPKWVDRYVGTGTAAAMLAVHWIAFTDDGVSFPNFDRHNGESAKRRGEAAIRQRLSRKNRDTGVTGVTRDLIPRPFVRHVMERDGYQCVYCGTQSDAAREASKKSLLSIDHIIPNSRGGITAVSNLVCCCKACNQEKNDRTPAEWGLEPTFLQPGVTYRGESDGVASVSQLSRDTSVTREEKRREEKKEKPRAGARPLSAYIEECKAKGEKPIPDDDPIFDYAEKVGLPFDYLSLAWGWFKEQMAGKRKTDWRAHFRNAVKGNWPKYWYPTDDGGWRLSPAGEQARRAAA